MAESSSRRLARRREPNPTLPDQQLQRIIVLELVPAKATAPARHSEALMEP